MWLFVVVGGGVWGSFCLTSKHFQTHDYKNFAHQAYHIK
jgi:hypothetical protein